MQLSADGTRLEMVKPCQFHAHLRTGWLMELTLRFLVKYYQIIVAMPNITEVPQRHERPLVTLDDLCWYRELVNATLKRLGVLGKVKIYYMMKLTPSTTPRMIEEFVTEPDILAMKEYPEGTTTNSRGGVKDIRDPALRDTLQAMEACHLPLSRHVQEPGVPLDQAEAIALPSHAWLMETFLRLRVVMEHVSTREGLCMVRNYPPERSAGTLTIHHRLLTAGDVFGHNHNFCLPVANTQTDRRAVDKEALSGDPHFFSADDCAPHCREKKECGDAAAGVFNADVSCPLTVERAMDAGRPETLEPFMVDIGCNFYHLTPDRSQTITLINKPWRVDHCYGDGNGQFVVPFCADKMVNWQLADD